MGYNCLIVKARSGDGSFDQIVRVIVSPMHSMLVIQGNCGNQVDVVETRFDKHGETFFAGGETKQVGTHQTVDLNDPDIEGQFLKILGNPPE